jgi:scyllo-inositol 2-dehydrogenase (NADP+)
MVAQVMVGLIGYGIAGRVFHALVIQAVPGLKLTQVVERHGESSRDRYPWVSVVNDVDALLNNPEIDLVVVATPNSSHFELAKRALSKRTVSYSS